MALISIASRLERPLSASAALPSSEGDLCVDHHGLQVLTKRPSAFLADVHPRPDRAQRRERARGEFCRELALSVVTAHRHAPGPGA